MFGPPAAPTHILAGDRFGDISAFVLPPPVRAALGHAPSAASASAPAAASSLSSSSSAAATATAASAASAAQAAAQELDARASFGHFSQCTALVAAGSAARPLIVRYASQRRGKSAENASRSEPRERGIFKSSFVFHHRVDQRYVCTTFSSKNLENTLSTLYFNTPLFRLHIYTMQRRRRPSRAREPLPAHV